MRPQCGGCSKRERECSWPQGAIPYHHGHLDRNEPGIGSHQSSHTAAPNAPSTFLKTPFVLPAPHLLERLFRIFLNRHHEAEFCSFLHKPSLDVTTLYLRSPCLVTSIISLAALYVPNHEAVADFGFDSPSTMSNHFASFAKSHANTAYDEPSSKLSSYS